MGSVCVCAFIHFYFERRASQLLLVAGWCTFASLKKLLSVVPLLFCSLLIFSSLFRFPACARFICDCTESAYVHAEHIVFTLSAALKYNRMREEAQYSSRKEIHSH